MSRDYDDRIVRMGFDNAQFESGTKQTMTTLDKLNEKLKLPGASEGSKNVQTAVDSVDFSAMEKAILNIEKRFSTLGVVSMNVISKITNGITSSVAKLEATTLGQIKTGGWNRAMNIANAKFQIEGLGFAWEQVEKAVSYGVKDTAYGLDAAASAASQLAASGVDFQEVLETVNGQELTAMHKSLRAISGVAAMTNSSYEDIARIFTTVAGNGRLMGDQLLQLSSRGMNAAAKLAETLGTTEGEIRDMVSRGQIDFQTFAFAMDNAFGDHAKEANKTFTGALGNMKAALSRVGEIFSDPIINKTNTLFISLTTRIDEFKNKLKSIKVPRTLEEIEKKYAGISKNATAYTETLKGMGDRTIKLGEDFANMWQSGIDAFSAMIKSVNLDWFDKVVEKVDKTVNKVTEFFDLIKEIYGESAEEAADSINDATKTLLVSAEEAQAARDIIDKGMYGSGDARKNALAELFGGGEEGKKHAANVQAYIDSVVAASWSYKNAAIQVEDSNKLISDSQTDMAREVKKARIKTVIEDVKKTFSNLWKTAKNLGSAASSIMRPILSAFGSVFDLDFSNLTSGTASFTDMLVKLSEKLIVSDKTAEKIEKVFTRFFEIIKIGLGYLERGVELAKSFVTALVESDAVTTLTGYITDLLDKVLEMDALQITDDNPILKFLTSIIDAVDGLISGNENTPSKLTTFINDILKAVKGINWKYIGNIAGSAFLVYQMVNLVLGVRKLGKLILSIADLPASITRFFNNLGNAVSNMSGAFVVSTVAKSLAIVAGAVLILSQIPDEQLYKALGTIAIIALLIKFLSNIAISLGNGKTINSFKELISSFKTVFSAVKVIGSLSVAFLALAGAASIIGIGMAIIEKSGAAKPSALLPMIILLGALSGVVIVIGEWLQTVNPKTMVKMPVVFGAMSVMFVALGGAVLAMSTAMKILSTIPSDSFGLIITLMGVMFVGTALIIKMATDAKAKELLTASVTIAAIGGAMSAVILAVAGAAAVISYAASLLTNVNTDAYLLLLTGIFTVFLTVIFLTNKANSIQDTGKVVTTLLAMSVAMIAIGGATALIAGALVAITNIGGDNVDTALLVLASILGGLVILMYMTTALKPTQLLASAVMFIGVASAILVMSAAVALLANMGGSKMIEAAGAIVMALVGLGVAVTIASASLSAGKNSIGYIVASVLALSVAMLIISSAISKLGDTKHMTTAVSQMLKLTIAIAAVIAVLSIVGKIAGGSDNALLAAGTTFLMVSASLLVLTIAIEKMASVINAPGVVGAIAVMGVFLVLVGGLAIAAALIPGAAVAFEAVGKAFLYAGVGAALVGAGIYLVAKGVKILAPAVAMLGISLGVFFTALEDHKVAAIAFGVITLALIAALTIAIIKLSPVIEAVANVISATVSKTGKVLKNGESGLQKWVSNLSTKGKATIAALITTLCGAILKASPDILNTIGQLLIKLLSYLGSIAGDLAEGLIQFLVNLINGLTLAIRRNSALIAAALWGVFYALTDVVVQILGQLLYMLVKPFSEGLAEEIQKSVTDRSKDISQLAEEHQKMAEEMAKNNQDYIDSIRNTTKATADSCDKSADAISGLTDNILVKTGEQKDALGGLNDEYAKLTDNGKNLAIASNLWNKNLDVKTPSTDNNQLALAGMEWADPNDPDAYNKLIENMGMTSDNAAESGEEFTSAYNDAAADALDDPDEYYTAETNNMGGVQDAIKDSEKPTYNAVKTYINAPATQALRENRRYMYEGAEFIVDGAIKYIEHEGSRKYNSAITFLMREGQDAARKANEIKSPSRVYYDIAAFMVAGLVNGIEQNTSDATDAMGGLSSAIISAFGDPIDYVSKIASGELVYDPHIRPVFDGSNVYRGASSINSMINGQTMTVAGFSGKLASDINTLDNSNAEIIAELRALREDMTVLGDELSDMQIVMDTGALVGATAGPMDKALGARSIRYGRG